MPNTITRFQDHPFIQSIAKNPRWTFSLTQDKKMPVDMCYLMETDNIRGANFYEEKSLVSLDTVDNFFSRHNQQLTNHTYYLDALLDNFVILDIESDCPDDIKQKLLDTNFIYGETSLSGKGYHLIFNLPPCFDQYPASHRKPAIKEEHKYYEILLNHFCTFTGNMIEPPANPSVDFNDIYKALAEHVVVIEKTKQIMLDNLDQMPQTKYAPYILDTLERAADLYRKKPQDYPKENSPGTCDMSRYEWSYIAYLYWKLSSILAVQTVAQEHTYTDEEQAYFLYQVAKEKLPHRPKHDTYRNAHDGTRLPWLAYLVKDILEKSDNFEQPDEKSKRKKRSKTNVETKS